MKRIVALIFAISALAPAQTLTLNQTSYRTLVGVQRPIWWRLCTAGSADNCTVPGNATVDLTVTAGSCTFGGSSSVSAADHATFTAPSTAGTCTITAQAEAGGSPSTITVTAYAGRQDHRVSPFYSVLYRGQTTVLQSVLYGYADTTVASWAVSPNNGGVILTGSGRSIAVTAYAPGTYTVTATSTQGSLAGTATIVVTSAYMPGSATAVGTFPIDCTAVGSGTTYNVTDSASYAAVPWNSLVAGDTVRVGYNGGTPYPYSVQLSQRGTRTQPIRICGVRDSATGNLPIITGQSAQFAGAWPSNWQINHQGLFVIHGGSISYSRIDQDNTGATSYLVIEGFELAWADAPYTVGAYSWTNSSAGIYARGAYDVVVRGNYIHDCGMGILTSPVSGNTESQHVRRFSVEGNRVENNAVNSSGSMHNLYLQGEAILVQGNWIGRNKVGSLGSSLKIRAAGSWVRYNHILGTLRDVDFVEIQDWAIYAAPAYFPGSITGEPSDQWSYDDMVTMHERYQRDYMYANILNDDETSTAGWVPAFSIHYFHDVFPDADHSTTTDTEHGGTLYFFYNTWYQYRTVAHATVVAFDMTRAPSGAVPNQWTQVDAVNNAIYLGGVPHFHWTDSTAARATIRKNWISTMWNQTTNNGGTVTGYFHYECSATPDVKCYPSAYPSGAHHVTDLGLLSTSTRLEFSATTYLPSGLLIGTAASLPTAISDLTPLMSYYPATHTWGVRASIADMGAIDSAAPLYLGPVSRFRGMRLRGVTVR